MRFSIRWLKEYLQTDLPTQRILEALVDCGLEVESVVDLGLVSGNLVTGKIKKIEPIEGADKIRLCTVEADSAEPLKIVCGAHNIEEGDVVPIAKFGMKFPDGFVLKPRKIMGIEGQGMICSPKELGVAEDADGIWILDAKTPIGEPYDAIVEISITPNRPDALSIIGVARDLAAKISTYSDKSKPKVKLPEFRIDETEERTDSIVRVKVEAKDACPRYTARLVRDVHVAPSPRWMQLVLESAGLRPINNVVDISNFVLLEMGHPLHTFDLHRLNGQQINVRYAKPGETIDTLDGESQKLEETDLLICDSSRPVALAGIMGGANSEISESTTDVLIESAYFDPPTIRKTSKRLDKQTDSSYRFERGTDIQRVSMALNRCAQLLAEYAGGNVCKGVIDIAGKLPSRDPILVNLKRLNRRLGLELTGREISNILTPLGFEIQRSDREEMLIESPSYRVDVSLEADIIEEVARIYGYDRIPEQRLYIPAVSRDLDPEVDLRVKLAQGCLSLGYNQVVNYSFISEGGNRLIGFDEKREVKVSNPVHSDMSVMRAGMLPSLLSNISYNLNRGVENISIFELGSTYEYESAEPVDRDEKDMQHPAIETYHLAGALCADGSRNWTDKSRSNDFFTIKGHVEYLLTGLDLKKLVVENASDIEWLHPGRSARFLVKGKTVALFGEVHPGILAKTGIKRPVLMFDIPVTSDLVKFQQQKSYSEIPRYPSITRDIALVVDETVRSLDLERTIKKVAKDLLYSVKLFDVYQGEHVDEGKKSLAYSLIYQSLDRTLKEEEVTTLHEAVIKSLDEKHGAVLR